MKNLYKLIIFIVGLNFILLSSFAQGVNEEVPPRYGESSFYWGGKVFLFARRNKKLSFCNFRL